ncbi:MAG: hypothetical protein EPN91_09810 [Salinibacterium sp.]|nr:MAG: hypothetical protein EPN91_09810 [Salinibacterium sp.]
MRSPVPPGCYELAANGGWFVVAIDGSVELVERELLTHSRRSPTPAGDLAAALRDLARDIEGAGGDFIVGMPRFQLGVTESPAGFQLGKLVRVSSLIADNQGLLDRQQIAALRAMKPGDVLRLDGVPPLARPVEACHCRDGVMCDWCRVLEMSA